MASAQADAHAPSNRPSLSDRPEVRLAAAEPGVMSCFISWPHGTPLVSDVVQLFESLGLRVSRHVAAVDVDQFDLLGWKGDIETVGRLFCDAVGAIHTGAAERDGLNRLVVGEGLSWRQVLLARALCRYLRQTGVTPGLDHLEQTLVRNGAAVRAIVNLFEARFDPVSGAESAEAEAVAHLEELLESVSTLADDQVLRALADVVMATMRTSYYCVDGSGEPLNRLSLKIESRRLAFLPAPRPLVETFVYSPQVEGLHLRAGRVARGGIRWSERPADFRTEVLGLMKAQSVKNSVIVPAGAKGAFVVRQAWGGPEVPPSREEVRDAYATFVRGLLDVTDNLVGRSEQHPARVRCHDGVDAYLVVAADKGTSTFSDLANDIAGEYGFWLGDAFASGGSSGYDHKGMGITARGAWVSVEAHLRELGFDEGRDELTVVGIGDLSGDVFGNGMLSSDRIRLVAAFDHRHIFLDPDPDPAASYDERRRVASLETSDWTSYDEALISPGGGVYSRRAKRVPVSPRVRGRLGLGDAPEWMTPDELVRAVLAAPVTLLWNGGIGTYVKASDESQAAAGDKSNEAVRVEASQLRCRVIGEGGNLGLTQRARIEYASRGGRLNADFVDNAAGVATSDREVNLKILLDAAQVAGRIRPAQRDELMAAMQSQVAESVLQDVRRQCLAISLAAYQGTLSLDRHARLIALLERIAGLERKLEALPEEDELARRRTRGEGLTRPELAALLAWSKISVREGLLESRLPDDPTVQAMLMRYFPQQVRFPDLIAGHHLAREISGTVLANDIVNQAGPGFFCRLEERTGAQLPETAAAFVVVREVFGLGRLWSEVEAWTTTLSNAGGFAALDAIQQLLEHGAAWLLRNRPSPLDITAEIARLTGPVADVRAALVDVLDDQQRSELDAAEAALGSSGLPVDLARRAAECTALLPALDITELASTTGTPVANVAGIYFEVGRRLDLEWLRSLAALLGGDPHWRQLAKLTLAEDVRASQRAIVLAVLGGGTTRDAVESWLSGSEEPVRRHHALLDELRSAAEVDLAMITVAAQQVRLLAG